MGSRELVTTITQLGFLHVSASADFGPIIALAVVAGVVLAGWRCARRKLFEGRETSVGIAAAVLLGAWVGCRLVPIAVSPEAYLRSPEALLGLFTSSAGAWYGAFLGGLCGLLLFCRRRRLPALGILDAVAPSVALGKTIGPFACLRAGCDHGVPAPEGLPWAVTYLGAGSAVDPALRGVPLHPAPLYDAAANLAILAVILAVESSLRRRGRSPAPGSVFALYCLLYAPARFVLEFWRGDASRGFWLGGALSTSQFLSILVVAAVLAAALVRRAASSGAAGRALTRFGDT